MRSSLSALACGFLAAALLTAPALAQTGAGVDPAYANSGHFIAFVLRPRDALAHPAIAKLGIPERIPELTKDTSFEPGKMEELVFLVGANVLEGPRSEPEMAVVLRFSEPLSQAKVMAAPAFKDAEKKQAGATSYYLTPNGQTGYLFVGDRTMVISPASHIAALAQNAKGQGPLVEVLKSADGSRLAQLHVVILPIRTKLTTLLENAPLPDPFGPTLKELPKVVDQLTLSVGKDLAFAWNTTLTDNAEAEKFSGMLKLMAALGQTGMDSLIEEAQREKAPANIQKALADGKRALTLLKPEVKGKEVNVTLEGPAVNTQVAPIFAGLLGSLEEARGAAKRAQSMNNVKQILIALLNYESTHNHLPPAFTTDQGGKPLLSWRVAILPYLEQEALYKQFKLDEPWDSPHNKQLIAKMPKVFAAPNSKAGEGKTTYLAIRGKNCLLDKEAVKLPRVLDGLSNTVAVVETADDRAVEWTRPDDFSYDTEKPAKGLDGVYGEQFLAGFADGHVQLIKVATPVEMLRRLFDIADGKLVELD